jgi:indole-3-glycerol phosphate synthase
MSRVLEQICRDKLEYVRQRAKSNPISNLIAATRDATAPRGFIARLEETTSSGAYGLIAEIKKASPSKGLIRADFDPTTLASAYARGGATCLSVLTDIPYFSGDDAYLIAARKAVDLPVLRKDFMLDPYQIIESRAIGADCVLLILAAIDDQQAREMASVAHEFGMDTLVEVHNRTEMDRALDMGARLVGINNRNLKTLQVDLTTTEQLAPIVPADRMVVCESGLSTSADLARMAKTGVRCFLIGESLMRQSDVSAATRALIS